MWLSLVLCSLANKRLITCWASNRKVKLSMHQRKGNLKIHLPTSVHGDDFQQPKGGPQATHHPHSFTPSLLTSPFSCVLLQPMPGKRAEGSPLSYVGPNTTPASQVLSSPATTFGLHGEGWISSPTISLSNDHRQSNREELKTSNYR